MEERESDFWAVNKMTVKSDLGVIAWCLMLSGMTAERGDKVAFKTTLARQTMVVSSLSANVLL